MQKKETKVPSVFEDLGFANHEEKVAKAELAIQINALIKVKKLTQKAAAEFLGIDQPKVSALHKGRLAGFSLERLFKYLNLLGQQITIKISPKTRTKVAHDISVSVPKVKKIPVKNNLPAARPMMMARKKRSK
jgi:predicted XRE-type DNA-binding protein